MSQAAMRRTSEDARSHISEALFDMAMEGNNIAGVTLSHAEKRQLDDEYFEDTYGAYEHGMSEYSCWMCFDAGCDECEIQPDDSYDFYDTEEDEDVSGWDDYCCGSCC